MDDAIARLQVSPERRAGIRLGEVGAKGACAVTDLLGERFSGLPAVSVVNGDARS